VALYFARIPAGLAIVVSMVAVGFTIVCVVCCIAAPRTLSYDGVNVPAGMSSTAFNSYASSHPGLVICNFNYHSAGNLQVPCQYDRATNLGKIGFGKGGNGPPPGVRIKIPSKTGTPTRRGPDRGAELRRLLPRVFSRRPMDS